MKYVYYIILKLNMNNTPTHIKQGMWSYIYLFIVSIMLIFNKTFENAVDILNPYLWLFVQGGKKWEKCILIKYYQSEIKLLILTSLICHNGSLGLYSVLAESAMTQKYWHN